MLLGRFVLRLVANLARLFVDHHPDSESLLLVAGEFVLFHAFHNKYVSRKFVDERREAERPYLRDASHTSLDGIDVRF